MGTRDPRVDAYIAKQAEFARPILAHIREVVHAACPEVKEEMKWSTPFFTYHGNLCQMAAFKEHCAFGFWKGALVVGRGSGEDDRAAGQFGRITSLKDLPAKKELTAFIKKAMQLNEEGVRVPKEKKSRPPLPVPPELTAALAKNRKAREVFEAFSPSHKRDYCEWIGDAKREETKAARVAQAVEWIAEGKPRHWKYQERR
ncbi:MAG TPA: YdeI/OmpD-associated family protein [Gemmatimonadaceae bacterium]|nr:YdeI/OmpD-associated family protein [Gemmatimonadaceae bacterium]